MLKVGSSRPAIGTVLISRSQLVPVAMDAAISRRFWAAELAGRGQFGQFAAKRRRVREAE